MHSLRKLAIAGLTASAALASVAHAAPQQADVSQVSGYYHHPVGELMVTAVYDGYLDLDTQLLKGLDAEDMSKLFERMFLQDNNGVQTAVNAFIVQSKDRTVLVDAGAAQCFGPTMGSALDNIQAAGFQPGDIDSVLLTHLHPDHACGLATQDGQAVFPNATVWVAQADADFWLDAQALKNAPEDKQPFFKLAQDSVAPYIAREAFHTYQDDSELLAEIGVVPTPGHTPGHSSYLVESEGEALLIWGDIVHSHSVQLQHPDVSIEFDSDPQQAIKTRIEILRKAAAERWLVAGAHMPFPGLGHLRAEDQGYTWVPVEYSPIRTDR